MSTTSTSTATTATTANSTQFAAVAEDPSDPQAVFGLGYSPEEALAEARHWAGEEARFRVVEISPSLAEIVVRDGGDLRQVRWTVQNGTAQLLGE